MFSADFTGFLRVRMVRNILDVFEVFLDVFEKNEEKNLGRKCAINNFWTKNPRGVLGRGSRGSRQIIYARIFPNV